MCLLGLAPLETWDGSAVDEKQVHDFPDGSLLVIADKTGIMITMRSNDPSLSKVIPCGRMRTGPDRTEQNCTLKDRKA